MAEASKPKYDSLPGIDTAPDVYETPELAEDVSTIQASTAVSESESEEGSDIEASKVHHQRLQTDQARHRFQPSRVDAHNVDFSDNISGTQRRSYRTSTRARRRGEIIGDDSDEEEESFERKLARVRQEALELEQEYAERVQSGDRTKTEERDSKEIMEFISDKVDSIYAQRRGENKGSNNSSAESQLSATIQKFNNYTPFAPSPRISKAIANQPPLPGSQIQRSQLDHVLNQASDFDARLTRLEQSLGLNGSTMPDVGSNAPLPIFTTLERIEESVGLMTDASSGSLETASTQIRRLITEAEHLKQLRSSSSSPSPSSPLSPSPNTANENELMALTPAQESKINALYGTLPSLDKLTPILPLVLDRLRTLRLVHTSAHQADAVLAELESRQSQQAAEIAKWAEKLGELEKEVRAAEERTEKKVGDVGEVVRGVEARVRALGGA